MKGWINEYFYKIGIRMVMSVLGCVSMCLCVCIYKGLFEIMIIDGIVHLIGHALLKDLTYDTSELIYV